MFLLSSSWEMRKGGGGLEGLLHCVHSGIQILDFNKIS